MLGSANSNNRQSTFILVSSNMSRGDSYVLHSTIIMKFHHIISLLHYIVLSEQG